MTLSSSFSVASMDLHAISHVYICSLLCSTKNLLATITTLAVSLHHACRHHQGCWEQPSSTLAVL